MEQEMSQQITRAMERGGGEVRGTCVLVVSEELPVCKTMSRSVLSADICPSQPHGLSFGGL